jgi:hypothetical protein
MAKITGAGAMISIFWLRRAPRMRQECGAGDHDSATTIRCVFGFREIMGGSGTLENVYLFR